MKGTDVMRAEKADQAVLWEALDETGDSIAGTALLGLAGLVRAGAPVEQDRLAQAALRLANNGGAGELTHITAYQVCGGLNIQAALPTIETAAQGSPTLSQQISAIGALGMLGGTTDIRLLQALLEGHEERLKPAVRLALDRIAARQNQAVNR